MKLQIVIDLDASKGTRT